MALLATDVDWVAASVWRLELARADHELETSRRGARALERSGGLPVLAAREAS